MEKHEEANDILNDLVKINNDRIAGYEKAITEAKDLDIDLKAIFEGMILESQEYKRELFTEIEANGGKADDDTTTSGKIYRAWMDIKTSITDSDRHSILASCEFGEDAAQRAYGAALESHGLVGDPEAYPMVKEQKESLKKSHDMIKKQREAHGALK